MEAELFERHADRPCLVDGGRTLTYSQTLALGRRLTAGLPARALVMLQCSLTAESVAAHAALMADGHVPLLVEADLAGELAAALAAAYRPHAVIDPAAGTREDGPGTELHGDLGLLLATSGSTGSPKLVRHTARGMRANAGAIAEYLAIGPEERALLSLPMSYSYGLSVVHSHLVAGACLVLTRASVMEPGYWEALAAGRATSVAGVPFHYQALRRFAAKLETPDLRTLTQAGGRLDPKAVAWFAGWAAERGRRFVVMYGQTEAGPRIAWLPPDRAAEAPDAIGVPIPGVTVELLDEDGRAVPDGTPGEMVVTSPAVMMGYARSAADLALGDAHGGRLATGDMAVRGPDGLLRVTGRRSRMLKIYGLRLDLDEVERRLAAEGFAAACFGEDDRMRVLLEAGDPAAARARITALFSLPPRGVEVRAAEALPRAPSGKVAAAGLAAAWEAAGAGGAR